MRFSAETSRYILGMRVDATTQSDAARQILAWARGGESRAVCAASTHTVMEGHHDPAFRAAVNRCDLVVPDGRPLAWGLRLLGARAAEHVRGTDLSLEALAAAEREGIAAGLYGSTPAVLDLLIETLRRRFPRLQIAYAESPPFRPLSPEEDRECVNRMNASDARILLVGLGCPRQEAWVSSHVGRVRAVMLAVGAAFDFIAGTKPQAPRWMQHSGLEWLFRLATEPRRLWRRYATHNPRFAALFACQLLRARICTARSPSVWTDTTTLQE